MSNATPAQPTLDVTAEAAVHDLLRQIYRDAYIAAAKQLQTPSQETAKGLLNFERAFNFHDDVLSLPADERRKRLGERIKLQRQAQGIKQTELAAILGIAPQTLNVWESGKQEPAAFGLIGLSKALGVSTDWLLGIEP